IASTLADLRGGQLGTEVTVRFTTAATSTPDVPQIDQASPAYGLVAGGETVTVIGSGFLPGCAVRFGGIAAAVQSVAPSGRAVIVTVPAGVEGFAAVEVQNPGGLSAIRHAAYRYLMPP